MNPWFDDVRSVHDWMVARRRELHQHPEVGLELPWTHQYIQSTLQGLGYSPEVHASAGITVRVRGSDPDGIVSVLRADMDALPVTERTGMPYASTLPNAMHACGHDLHMAMLLGVAKVLTFRPPRRDTVLVFQPGEESDRGALAVLERHESLQFDGPATTFAIHVHAMADPGVVLCRPGVFMSYGDWFKATFVGRGGHASQPHLVGNPVEAIAHVVRGLRETTARLEGTEHIVATATEILAGNTVNVIPATGSVRGTIRTLSASMRRSLIDNMQKLVHDAANEFSLAGKFVITDGYPAVVNDSAYVERLQDRLQETELADLVRPMPAPSMVIEDFSYFLQRWPGAMAYLGARGPENTSFNHADDVTFDEGPLTVGAVLHLIAADGI